MDDLPEDECTCFLPEHNCPVCSKLKEEIYNREWGIDKEKEDEMEDDKDKVYETEVYGYATKMCTTHVCAGCWGELVIHPAPKQMWTVLCPKCGSVGYVTRYWAEEQRKISSGDLVEVKQVLEKAGIIENKHKGKSIDQLNAELGF